MSSYHHIRCLTRRTPGVVVDTPPGINKPHQTYQGPHGERGEAWQLDVGAECNLALEHCEHQELFVDHDPQAVAAIRSLVSRVIDFESLPTQPRKP